MVTGYKIGIQKSIIFLCASNEQLETEILKYHVHGREGDARGKRYGNICIRITDSLCYKAETNTPL